jgi:hypothetical protein
MFTYFCCGWEPILSPNCLPVAWKVISGKHFSLQSIQKIHSDPSRLIGLKHDCKETNYIILDIDHGSPHRNIDSIRKICKILSFVGLSKPIFIQSSNNGDLVKGIHIIWFLSKKTNTALLSELAHQQLGYYSYKIVQGEIEIFPNKSNGTVYKCKAIRLPLQPNSGSYILDENLQLYSDSIDELNRLILLNLNTPNFSILDLNSQPVEVVSSEKIQVWIKNLDVLLARGFRSPAQTQQLIRAAIDKIIVFDKITDLDVVCDKVKFIVINLKGYTQYCGHQHDIDKVIKTWVTKTLENEIRLPYRKHPKKIMTNEELIKDDKPKYNLAKVNKAKSNDTLTRLIGCIDWLVKNKEVDFNSLRAFRSRIKEISKQLYRIGIDESTVQKQKALWEGRIHIGKK